MQDYVIEETGDDGKYFNTMSVKQIQCFLYAPWNNAKINGVKIKTENITDGSTESTKINSKSEFVHRFVKFNLMNPLYVPNNKAANVGVPRMLNFVVRGLNLPI